MIYSPIWKDNILETTSTTLNYRIRDLEAVRFIDEGYTKAMPGQTGVTLCINNKVDDRLNPDFSVTHFPSVTNQVVSNPNAVRTFRVLNSSESDIGTYKFLYDWSYEDNWSGQSEHNMSETVNGHLDVRMKMMTTIYNSGETRIIYIKTDQPAYDPGSYLTFTILTPGTFKTQTPMDASGNPLAYYRINGGEWLTDYTTNGTEVIPGDIIEFKGYSKHPYRLGGGSCTYNVSGNLMSVVNGDNFSSLTDASDCSFGGFFQNQTNLISAEHLGLPATVLSDRCYQLMFSGCKSLTTAPVVLPATELTEGCYKEMFSGCKSLTKAPVLPAKTLDEECYNGMFWGCRSLTTAPELPATTLAVGCYENMFNSCSSLVNIPDLPATTLPSKCYSQMFVWCDSITTPPTMVISTAGSTSCYCMFAGCTALTSAPVLSATTVDYYCYDGMFQNCTSLTTAPVLPATVLGEGCYIGMFAGCASLTKAPDLPADELIKLCYFGMFSDCTSLNSVKCLATYIADGISTGGWLQNVSSSGTFVKASSMSGWRRGIDGIPNNWTITNA